MKAAVFDYTSSFYYYNEDKSKEDFATSNLGKVNIVIDNDVIQYSSARIDYYFENGAYDEKTFVFDKSKVNAEYFMEYNGISSDNKRHIIRVKEEYDSPTVQHGDTVVTDEISDETPTIEAACDMLESVGNGVMLISYLDVLTSDDPEVINNIVNYNVNGLIKGDVTTITCTFDYGVAQVDFLFEIKNNKLAACSLKVGTSQSDYFKYGFDFSISEAGQFIMPTTETVKKGNNYIEAEFRISEVAAYASAKMMAPVINNTAQTSTRNIANYIQMFIIDGSIVTTSSGFDWTTYTKENLINLLTADFNGCTFLTTTPTNTTDYLAGKHTYLVTCSDTLITISFVSAIDKTTVMGCKITFEGNVSNF